MLIHVGSKNPTKINGVKNILAKSEEYKDAEIVGIDAKVEEFGHPKTLEETITGAKERAKNVFNGAKLGFGIESGLFPVESAKSGYLETTVCAIYDGEQFHLGIAPAFEWPKGMTELILAGQDGSQAFKAMGLTSHEKIGTAKGAIFELTQGKIDRTKLNELAVTMSLIHLENPDLY